MATRNKTSCLQICCSLLFACGLVCSPDALRSAPAEAPAVTPALADAGSPSRDRLLWSCSQEQELESCITLAPMFVYSGSLSQPDNSPLPLAMAFPLLQTACDDGNARACLALSVLYGGRDTTQVLLNATRGCSLGLEPACARARDVGLDGAYVSGLRQMYRHDGDEGSRVNSGIYTPDGSAFLSVDNRFVAAYARATGERLGQREIPLTGLGMRRWRLTADGGIAALVFNQFSQSYLWHAASASGKSAFTPLVADGRVFGSAEPIALFSSGRAFVATAYGAKTLELWQLPPGASSFTTRTVSLGNHLARVLALDPAEKTLFVGCTDGAILTVDLASMTVVQTFQAHSGGVGALVYSAASRRLASIGWEDGVRLWDLSAQPPTSVALGRFSGGIAFSPNGKLLAVSDNHKEPPSLLLFDGTTGTPVGAPLRFGPGRMNYESIHPQFSPEGQELLLTGPARDPLVIALGPKALKLSSATNTRGSSAAPARGAALSAGGMSRWLESLEFPSSDQPKYPYTLQDFTIQGTVVDAEGHAQKGATVLAFPDNGSSIVKVPSRPWPVEATADATGKFTFSNLPRCSWQLVVRLADGSRFWGGVRFPDKELYTSLPSTVSVALARWPDRSLRGQVIQADGKPVAGASIFALPSSMHRERGSRAFPASLVLQKTQTDATGHFRLQGLSGEEYLVEAKTSTGMWGRAGARYNEGAFGPLTVPLLRPESMDLLRFRVVTDLGEEVQGAQIIYPERTDLVDLEHPWHTNAHGEWWATRRGTGSSLKPKIEWNGERFSADPIFPVHLDSSFGPTRLPPPTLITIPTGAVTVEATLASAAAPATPFYSRLFRMDGQELHPTSSDGKPSSEPGSTFTFHRVPAGQWQLFARGTDGTVGRQILDIPAGAHPRVEVALHPGRTVTGRLIDLDTQKPVAWARVSTSGVRVESNRRPGRDYHHIFSVTALSDPEGRFTLKGIEGGPRLLKIAPPGYLERSFVTLIPDDPKTSSFDVGTIPILAGAKRGVREMMACPGLRTDIFGEVVRVQELNRASPLARVIAPGDELLEINGFTTAGLDYEEINGLFDHAMRGPSRVVLRRPAFSVTLTVDVPACPPARE